MRLSKSLMRPSAISRTRWRNSPSHRLGPFGRQIYTVINANLTSLTRQELMAILSMRMGKQQTFIPKGYGYLPNILIEKDSMLMLIKLDFVVLDTKKLCLYILSHYIL